MGLVVVENCVEAGWQYLRGGQRGRCDSLAWWLTLLPRHTQPPAGGSPYLPSTNSPVA
jgi:hypothetical protein